MTKFGHKGAFSKDITAIPGWPLRQHLILNLNQESRPSKVTIIAYHLAKYLAEHIHRLPIYTFLIVAIALPCISWGAAELDTSNEPDAPWRIFADQIDYDKKTQTYTAEGNVILKQNNRKITADRILYNTDTMKAYATGHVVVTAGDDILTGERIEMDLNT